MVFHSFAQFEGLLRVYIETYLHFSDEREPYIKNLSGNNNSEIMSFESETAN